jgi:gas vesicle protein
MRKITTFITFIIGAAFVVLVMAGPAWSQEDTTSLVKQLREDTERFKDSVDKALDESKINGSQLEDEINGYVKTFKESIDHLQKNWEDHSDAKGAAEEVMTHGRVIDKFLKKHTDRFNSDIHTEWASVKLDIGRIAKANKLEVKW